MPLKLFPPFHHTVTLPHHPLCTISSSLFFRISLTNFLIDWLRFIPLLHASKENFQSSSLPPPLPLLSLSSLSTSHLFFLVIKGIYLLFLLLYTLFSLSHFHIIIIQNPPSIPAAIASLILSYFTGTIIIIDWHNLGFSLYLDRYNENHLLVILSKYLEGFICSFCHYHLSVSMAMSKWLIKTYHLSHVHVLYDRPPSSVFTKFSSSSSSSPSSSLSSSSSPASSSPKKTTNKILPDIPIDIRHNLFMKLQLLDDILFPYPLTMVQTSSTGSLSDNSSPIPGLSSSTIDPSWILEKTIQTIKYKVPIDICGHDNEVSSWYYTSIYSSSIIDYYYYEK